MTTKVPEGIKARIACTIRGVTYTKDQVLTAAQIKAIPHLDSLLSNGTLYAYPDIHRRRSAKGGMTPTHIGPAMLAAMTTDYDAVTAGDQSLDLTTVVAGHRVTATVAGGQAPFTIDWGGSVTEVLEGSIGVHVYATIGAKTVGVTDDNTDTDSVVATIVAMTVVATPGAAHSASIVIVGARTPVTVDWGDASADHSTGPHTYAGAGARTITVTDADNFTATTEVTAT